jgi:hypothetical protein
MFEKPQQSSEVSLVMMVQTSCPSCGKTGAVPMPYLGRTVGCKQCNTLFKVRSATAFRVAEEREEREERVLAGTGAHGGDDAWLDDMPPIMVDMPVRRIAKQRVPA